MTEYEKLVVSAYTGFLMVNMEDLHEFIEKTLGRPVFTHELALEATTQEIREKLKPEFIKLCKEDGEK